MSKQPINVLDYLKLTLSGSEEGNPDNKARVTNEKGSGETVSDLIKRAKDQLRNQSKKIS